MMVIRAHTFTKDEKNIMLLLWRGSKEQTIIDHTIMLQDRKESPLKLSLLGFSEHIGDDLKD